MPAGRDPTVVPAGVRHASAAAPPPGPGPYGQEPRYGAAFEQSGVGQALLAPDGVVVAVNDAACLLLGRAAVELIGRQLLDELVPTGRRPQDRAALAAVAAGILDRAQLEQRTRRPDGALVDTLLSVTAVRTAPGAVSEVAVCLQDVTALRTAEREAEQARLRWRALARDAGEDFAELRRGLRRAVLHDRLTRLPNRRLLLDRLHATVLRGGAVAHSLLLVDLDGLRTLNDFGQAAGDRALRVTADTLSDLVRAELVRPELVRAELDSGASGLVARVDGGRFAVLLEGVDPAHAEALAARVVAAVATDLTLPCGATVHVSACVGVAHGPACSADGLLASAEAATRAAKALGRGRVHVLDPSGQARLTEQRTLGAELVAAVTAERLAVHYQPVVELATGSVVGFEALVRWPHPTRGLLGPDRFLPLAASLDLLPVVDGQVLLQACRDATTWAPGPRGPVTVAVNVAPDHLGTPGFVDKVRRALRLTGLPATSLVLEVTETAFVADVVAAQRVLTELSQLGVGIAVDDFGTGWSSMLQLRQLPFDALKIDREFVRGLPDSADDTAICSSVIGLAAQLGVSLVAEGVEDADQAAALASLGCRYAQGFLWSPAVDAAAVLRLLGPARWAPVRARTGPDGRPAQGRRTRSISSISSVCEATPNLR